MWKKLIIKIDWNTQNSQHTQHITQARCKTTTFEMLTLFTFFFFGKIPFHMRTTPTRSREKNLHFCPETCAPVRSSNQSTEISNFSIENYIAAKRRKNYTNCRHDCLFRQLMGVWYSRRVCLTPQTAQLSQSLNIHKNHTPASDECERGSWKLMTFEFDLVDRKGKEKEMEFTCLLIFRLFPLLTCSNVNRQIDDYYLVIEQWIHAL